MLLEVLDSGPGISENVAGILFEPYMTRRIGVRRFSPDPFPGMSLAIARTSLRLAGGDMEVFNRDEGGACARMVLPPAP